MISKYLIIKIILNIPIFEFDLILILSIVIISDKCLNSIIIKKIRNIKYSNIIYLLFFFYYLHKSYLEE